MKKILTHILFNVILNGMDVGTDLKTFIELIWDWNHPFWASLTLTWMFNPFLFHSLAFFINFLWSKKVREKTKKRGFFKAFFDNAGVHFPFFVPLRNLWKSRDLYNLRYGFDDFKVEDSKEVEEILNEAAHASYSESFYEAGPQAVTQVVIMLSTGQVTWTQGVSLCTSVLSLSWGASRAFMIMRTKEERDPNPEISTLGLRVWPYMILSTIANLGLLVCTGGILGPYIFCSLVLNFVTVFGALKMTERKRIADPEKDAENQQLKEADDDDAPSLITASLCAVWIPCVVGRKSSNIFLTSAVTSLLTKVVVLVAAVCLVETDLQHHLQPRPFLLLCRDNGSLHLKASNVTQCSFTDTKNYVHCFADGETNAMGLQEMMSAIREMEQGNLKYEKGLERLRHPKHTFDPKNTKIQLLKTSNEEMSKLEELKTNITTTKLDETRKNNSQRILQLKDEVEEELRKHGVGIIQQKIRVCGPNEKVLRHSLYSGIFVAVLLATLSTFMLHKITGYQNLYNRSKTLFCCIEFPSLRVIHRSLLADKIKASNEGTEDLEELLVSLDKKETGPKKVTINKPDHKGVTPLHLSLEQDIKVTKQLLNHSAEINILNSEAKTALYLACQNNDIKRATTLLLQGAEFQEDPIENLLKIDSTENEMKDLTGLVLAISGSKDRWDIYDKLYNPKNNSEFLFKVVKEDKHKLLKIILMGNDPDRTEFLNKKNKEQDTLLHVAVNNGFFECATLLLGAGIKTEKANGKGYTPQIENLFKPETADKITPELVKALIRKVRTKNLEMGGEGADRLLSLKKSTNQHLFELVQPQEWDEVSEWRQVGFIHVLENPSLAEALVKWHSADEDKKAVAEDIVRKTMKKGGTTIDVEGRNVGSKGRQRTSPSIEEMAAWAWNVEHDMDEKCFVTHNSSDESCSMRLKEFKFHFETGVQKIELEVHEAVKLQYKGDTSTWIGKIGVSYKTRKLVDGTEVTKESKDTQTFKRFYPNGTELQVKVLHKYELDVVGDLTISGFCDNKEAKTLKMSSGGKEVIAGKHEGSSEDDFFHHSPKIPGARLCYMSQRETKDGVVFKFHWQVSEAKNLPNIEKVPTNKVLPGLKMQMTTVDPPRQDKVDNPLVAIPEVTPVETSVATAICSAKDAKDLVHRVQEKTADKNEAQKWLAESSNGSYNYNLVDRVDWAEVSRWKEFGLIHVLENLHLGAALLKWHHAEAGEKADAAEDVKKCINQGGVTAFIGTDAEDSIETIKEAKEAWNNLHTLKCGLADVGDTQGGWSDKDTYETEGAISKLMVEQMEQGGRKWIGKMTAWYGAPEGEEEEGWHGKTQEFHVYNEDGTAIKPEKTSEHDLIVDPGSIVTGFCNSTTPISLGVANEAGSGGLSVGDHFPGEQVELHHSPRDAKLLFLSYVNVNDGGYAFKFHWAANELTP